MLKLDDFFHLDDLDPLIEEWVADRSGLTIVAGIGLKFPNAPAGDRFLPSGRHTIFRTLLYQLLEQNPSARTIVITQDRDMWHIPRQFAGRARTWLVRPPYSYAGRIAAAADQRPDLLVVDFMEGDAVSAALAAAQGGVRVLSQIDTIFCGADLAHSFLDHGVAEELLSGLGWIITVQRMAMLCPQCKEQLVCDSSRLAPFYGQHPAAVQDPAPVFYRSVGCGECNGTGRHGDVAVFDVFRADPQGPNLTDQPSVLPMADYALRLARLGHLSFGDAFHLNADILRRTYNMLTASEAALSEANAALVRKVAELTVSNRVLERQTEALISVRDIGQALIASTDLSGLARRVCHHARDLCGADRAVLYLAHPEGGAEILAVSGWNPACVGQGIPGIHVFGEDRDGTHPVTFGQLPPGVPIDEQTRGRLPVGLRVPLVAQQKRVGTMIVHTTQKSGFAPGAVSLLQTFANQAALAIQRAELFEQLHDKIAQLEAAQVGLAQKERMERELELAREVQQSVLPRIFPTVPGYRFAARNEPARQVGGDFYDVVQLDGDSFGLVIADVSDKGMPAALYMALTRSLILAEARRERSPQAVLSNVNRLLLELGKADRFVTVFYGVVDTHTRRLTFARAGHDYPLLLRGGMIQTLRGKGAFLGFLDQDELGLTQEYIDLFPGDRLVLYTDGLTDVCASNGELLGLDRLCAVLQHCADSEPSELCDAVFSTAFDHQATMEQFDDMTMLVAQVGNEGV